MELWSVRFVQFTVIMELLRVRSQRFNLKLAKSLDLFVRPEWVRVKKLTVRMYDLADYEVLKGAHLRLNHRFDLFLIDCIDRMLTKTDVALQRVDD